MPATIDATIEQIINNAILQADTYLEKADRATQSAINASLGYAFTGKSLVNFTPDAIEPDVPTVADTKISYDAQLSALVALLSGQLAGYYATYYPLVSDAYDEATAWLVNTITVGGTGISPSVEAQIWARGRTRIITEGKRVERQSLDEFAGRGFTLPPGALVGKLQEIRFEQLSKSSDLSAQVAIKQAEVEIENIKFAVDLAMKTRIAAMSAANDYIRAIATAPSSAVQYAALGGEAQARMMSATADLYRARLQRDDLILRSSDADQSNNLQSGIADMNGWYKRIENQVNAANAGAKAYGQSAAAALHSLNTVASSSQSLF